MLTGLFIFAGCAGPVDKPEQTGFLSDYSRLELIENDNLRYVSERSGEYDSFIIDPIAILFLQDAEDPVFSNKELEDLLQHCVDALTKQLSKDPAYPIVTEPGPRVARVRLGLTEVDDTIGLLNVSIYTKISGLGLGGASIEGEIVDSVTGEQLAAAIRWGSGSRVLRAGYTHTGDAKIQIDKWAKQLRKQLDERHGR
jgi:hypothetical protein